MLLALAKKLLTQARSATPDPAWKDPSLPIGTLTSNEEYTQLHYGDVEGIGTVTIDRTGNMVGFSPVERCIDERTGEIAWIPTELIRNLRLTPFPFVEGPAPLRSRTSRTKAETK